MPRVRGRGPVPVCGRHQFAHTRLLFILSRLVPTEGLTATHPFGMAVGEEPMGIMPFPQGLCPAALGQSTIAISYSWGSSRAPFPQRTSGERLHCINS